MPEAQIILAQAVSYIATAPKSNAACEGIFAALDTVKQTGNLPVPTHLQDAHYKGAAKLGHGVGYKYAHDYPGHFADLEFMPAELSGRKFYEPAENKQEDALRARLEGLWPKYYK